MKLPSFLSAPLRNYLRATILISLPASWVMADTPRLLDDPEAYRKAHPLPHEPVWTDFATPEQQRLFEGPEVAWPVIPQSGYDLSGFNKGRLFSAVPPAGVHPRVLFSPEDVPLIKKEMESSKEGQRRLIETDYFLSHTLYDATTDEGKIFHK